MMMMTMRTFWRRGLLHISSHDADSAFDGRCLLLPVFMMCTSVYVSMLGRREGNQKRFSLSLSLSLSLPWNREKLFAVSLSLPVVVEVGGKDQKVSLTLCFFFLCVCCCYIPDD